jgi:predicted solute-binding protein
MGEAPGGRLQLGWIPYWNLHPLLKELQRLNDGSIEVVTGHPSEIHRLLGEGQIHLAPSSSIGLLKNSNVELALPLGVASYGPVQSVYFGLYRAQTDLFDQIKQRSQILRQIFQQGKTICGNDYRRLANFVAMQSRELQKSSIKPRVKFSAASAASNMLGKILLRLWYGASISNHVQRDVESTGDFDMELVIGDEALLRRREFTHVIDFGQVWHELTGLPFVFAVWQMQKNMVLPTTLRTKIMKAAELASARMHVDPSTYLSENFATKQVDLAAYWRSIYYKLDAEHFTSLALYFGLAATLFPETIKDEQLLRVARWQDLSHTFER